MAQLYLLPFVAFGFSMVHFGPAPTIAAIFFIISLQVFFILLLQKRFDRSETQVS